MFGRVNTLVGLDIGAHAVKAVQLHPVGKAYRLVACGTELLPPQAVVAGAIVDDEAVTDGIGRLFRSTTFTTVDVCAALSGAAVVVKRLQLPSMSASELNEAMPWEAQQHLPFDINDAALEFRILERPEDDASPSPMVHVLLVAADKRALAALLRVISRAGARPVTVDVNVLALQNAFEINYEFDRDRTILLLDVGATSVCVNVLRGSQPTFTGTFAGSAGLDVIANVRTALVEATSDECPFHIDRIVVSGGAAQGDGLNELLRDQFDVPVEIFDPFRRIQLTGSDVLTPPASAAIAVGLALRRSGDR